MFSLQVYQTPEHFKRPQVAMIVTFCMSGRNVQFLQNGSFFGNFFYVHLCIIIGKGVNLKYPRDQQWVKRDKGNSSLNTQREKINQLFQEGSNEPIWICLLWYYLHSVPLWPTLGGGMTKHSNVVVCGNCLHYSKTIPFCQHRAVEQISIVHILQKIFFYAFLAEQQWHRIFLKLQKSSGMKFRVELQVRPYHLSGSIWNHTSHLGGTILNSIPNLGKNIQKCCLSKCQSRISTSLSS